MKIKFKNKKRKLGFTRQVKGKDFEDILAVKFQ